MKDQHNRMKFRSPSIVVPHLEAMGKKIYVLQKWNYQLKNIIKIMENDKEEVAKINVEVVFDQKEIKKLYNKLLAKEEVPEERFLITYLKNTLQWVDKSSNREHQRVADTAH